jgi:hypothetical protein
MLAPDVRSQCAWYVPELREPQPAQKICGSAIHSNFFHLLHLWPLKDTLSHTVWWRRWLTVCRDPDLTCCLTLYYILFWCLISASVAKGPKFRPQSTKRAGKKLAGPGKSGAELLLDLSQKGRKGAEVFSSLIFHKSSIFPALQTIPINWFTYVYLPLWILNHWKNFKIIHFQSMLCGGRTFSLAAEFFCWFSRKFLKLVGSTDFGAM